MVVFIVLIIFSNSGERNDQLRRCLFLFMARLLVTGFFGNTCEKICQLTFLSFFACGETIDSDTFVFVMKKLKMCFVYVDLYVRLIFDIIL